MSRLKSVLGYAVAVLMGPLVLITFLNLNGWMEILEDSGLRISPWISGDAVAFALPRDGYQIRIHRPVFMGLLWETGDGFVQVDWTPKESAPAVIDEEIDYDADGRIDFRIQWNTQSGAAALTPYSDAVLYLEGKYELKESWSVRVRIKNPQG